MGHLCSQIRQESHGAGEEGRKVPEQSLQGKSSVTMRALDREACCDVGSPRAQRDRSFPTLSSFSLKVAFFGSLKSLAAGSPNAVILSQTTIVIIVDFNIHCKEPFQYPAVSVAFFQSSCFPPYLGHSLPWSHLLVC